MQAIHWHKTHQTLLIVLTIAVATLLYPATTAHSNVSSVTIVTLMPGTDTAQLAADYQVTILNGVPELALYRLQGSDAQLAALGTDARVVSTEPDAPLDARPRWVDAHGHDVLSPQGGPYVATSILPDAYRAFLKQALLVNNK